MTNYFSINNVIASAWALRLGLNGARMTAQSLCPQRADGL